MAIPPRYPLLVEMRLENRYADAVKRILGETLKQVTADLNKLPAGTLTRMQLEAQRAAIKAYLASDWSDIYVGLNTGQKEAAIQASKVVSRYEEQLLGLRLSRGTMDTMARSFAATAASGVEAAMRRMEGTSHTTLKTTVYKSRLLTSGWVDDIINKGLAAGWDAKRLAKEILPSINPGVRGGVSYAAMRTARTEINNAFHASAALRYQNSPFVDKVDWHLSTSHPEGDVCDTLAAEGPYPVNAVPKKPHPHCYCYTTPSLVSEDEFLDNLLAGKYDKFVV